jgi:putative endonuclease
MSRTYCVYILASRSRDLYVGVTGNFARRMVEHRQGLIPGFTTRYRIFRLVHVETFGDVRRAIAREKKIKAWRREKKLWLIQEHNRTWEDLARAIGHKYIAAEAKMKPASRKADPSPAFAKQRRPGSG